MLDKLPLDVLHLVHKKLPLADVVSVKHTNKNLYARTTDVEKYIVIQRLRDHHSLEIGVMHRFLSTFVADILNYVRLTNSACLTSYKHPNPHYTFPYVLWFSQNQTINKLIHKVLLFVLQQPLPHQVPNILVDYSNQLELYVLYNLIQIDMCNQDLKRTVSFLKDFNIRNDLQTSVYLKNTLRNYFTMIISKHDIIPFEHLFEVSKYVVTVPMLIKLWGVYNLDIANSQFLQCCPTCGYADLTDMVNFKFHRFDDPFLSKNYSAIKELFAQQATHLYTKVCLYENVLVNGEIHYSNPYNNRSVKLSSRLSKEVLYRLHMEECSPAMERIKLSIMSFIRNKQRQLRQLYFG